MGEFFRAELAGSDDREAQRRLSTVPAGISDLWAESFVQVYLKLAGNLSMFDKQLGES